MVGTGDRPTAAAGAEKLFVRFPCQFDYEYFVLLWVGDMRGMAHTWVGSGDFKVQERRARLSAFIL